jgi:hypothetical protein
LREKKREGGYAPFLLIALLVAAAQPASAATQADAAPTNVLFIGNSLTYYNNSLHNHYNALIRSSGRIFSAKRVTRIMTISGGHLPEHRGGLPSMLASEDWDVVVLQGHSQGPVSEPTAEAFQAAARDYAAMIRERGARPMFFMTWAYEGKPEMTAALGEAYSAIGQELGAEVVPVGLAFARVSAERPDIPLRVADGKHPTLAGTYLAACVFYAALMSKSPVGLEYSAGLDAAAYLQAVAWQTVRDYKTGDAR